MKRCNWNECSRWSDHAGPHDENNVIANNVWKLHDRIQLSLNESIKMANMWRGVADSLRPLVFKNKSLEERMQKMSLENAIAFATVKHGQSLDKGNQPFIGHPLRVMAALAAQTYRGSILEAAVMHDVLEDTGTDPMELTAHGFSDDTVELVQTLTRPDDENYFDYIHRVAQNPMARIIKLADLADNLNPNRRVEGMKLPDRYLKAVEILKS